MKDKFYNKDGSLSRYSFACGYIQSNVYNRQDNPEKPFAQLFQDGCWHVKAYKDDTRILWECFDSLTEARKFYKQTVKVITQ